jgi:hypothetical protein
VSKKIIFILVVMLLSIPSCKTYDPLNNDNLVLQNQGHKIMRIRPKKAGYIIYSKKGDLRYQIISSKNDKGNKPNCMKIKRGKAYDLDLEVVHPAPGSVPNLAIRLKFGRLALPLRQKFHYKIYTARNLDGLCIIN